MNPDELAILAESGYLERGRVSKREYESHMALPAKIANLLSLPDTNYRFLKNQVVILFNVFNHSTAKALLYDACDNKKRMNTLLFSINRTDSTDIDLGLLERLNNV